MQLLMMFGVAGLAGMVQYDCGGGLCFQINNGQASLPAEMDVVAQLLF